jgi:hypothetical protein
MAHWDWLAEKSAHENVLKEFSDYSPFARFEISGEGIPRRRHFRVWLDKLLTKWVLTREPCDIFDWMGLAHEEDNKAEMTGICNRGLDHKCKVSWFDGISQENSTRYFRSLLFCESEDKETLVAWDILCLADLFAKFLRAKGIHFKLYIRKRSDHIEFIRTKFPE